MFFHLKNTKAAAGTAVVFVTGCDDGKLRYYTGVSIAPAKWNGGKPRDVVVASRMSLVFQKAAEFINDCKINRKPVKVVQLAAYLDKATKTQLQPFTDALSWDSVLVQVIENRAAGRELNGAGKRFSSNTIRNYEHSLKVAVDYFGRSDLFTISELDYQGFIAHLNAKQYRLNNVGSHIKNLRALLKAAHKQGRTTSKVFELFDIVEEDVKTIYLSLDEIATLQQVDQLNDTEALALDWFILQCFTGLRISDVKRVENTAIQDGLIRIVTEKTDTPVYIPIHPSCAAIIDKHQGFPPPLSEQKINKHIKHIARKAGIVEKVLITRTVGGVRQDSYVDKCELIGNHTGRRSFITNLLKNDLHQIEVMKLAGLKKLQTVQRYYKETEQELADRLKSHQFFSSSNGKE